MWTDVFEARDMVACNVNLLMGVDTKSAVKELLMMLEYIQQVAFLMCHEVILIFTMS
jgi:hypothetical protein